ncbi:FISUMP domain-containing protein, partial [Bacteroidota bacterium]
MFVKKLSLIFATILLVSINIHSKSFTVYDLDKMNDRELSVKFFALDYNNDPYSGLSVSDFKIYEDGIEKTVTNVICNQSSLLDTISSVLTIDVSSSMGWDSNLNMNLAKEAANTWIDNLPSNGSECAITSYNHLNYENHDWSTNKTSLKSAVNTFWAGGGIDYNQGFTGTPSGGIRKAMTGKFTKRVVVFLTDGLGSGSESSIISLAKSNNVIIYCVTLRMAASTILKNVASQTGGQCFDNVSTVQQITDIYKTILSDVTNSPCTIEWESDGCAGKREVVFDLITYSMKDTLSYTASVANSPYLDFDPDIIDFGQVTIGSQKDENVTLTARNGDIHISNITIDNAVFTVEDTAGKTIPFTLNQNDSITLGVRYSPVSANFSTGKLTITSDACYGNELYMNGSVNNDLVVTHPNGGEVFEPCRDTIITWANVQPSDTVIIEYSTDNGVTWDTITTEGVGLRYNWTVPNDSSGECLVRVTKKYQETPCTCEGDEVKIGDQKWTVCNLNVSRYSNGEIIPQVTDSAEWANLTTGAWCYYNNDTSNGECYGKLYNWYAVNDPRGLAPHGWHIPTDDEWKELEIFLGMSISEANREGENRGTVEGGKLKEAGIIHWGDPNTGATNSSGFSALPGGWRYVTSEFDWINNYAYFWSASAKETSNDRAWTRFIDKDHSTIHRYGNLKRHGFSVRCIKNKYTELCKVTWTAQNLDVEHYRNGDTIPQVTDPTAWSTLTTGAWCYYGNDQANDSVYGKLYNWYAVNDPRGLAPNGWHIPTDEEWKDIEVCLGMSRVQADTINERGTNEGGKLKEVGTIHWRSTNAETNNQSEFNGLPGGWRTQFGYFSYLDDYGKWWTSTERDNTYAWHRGLVHILSTINRVAYNKGIGFSVRCVRGDTVNICDQTWCVPNLNVDHYRNGDSIPEVTDPTAWAALDSGAWCYYNNDETNDPEYGKLYNWYAVNDPRGLAPEGWYIPCDEDWKELEMCLGMSKADADATGGRGTDEGGKLKSIGTIRNGDGLWTFPNDGATNESGFSAIPGGYRDNNGTYGYINWGANWWSSSELDNQYAMPRYLYYNYPTVFRTQYNKTFGISIRCLKGNEVQICDQTWSSNNLEVEYYRNGDPIPQVTDPTAWSNL